MTKGDRPEHTAPPEIFYNEEEARKYTTNSRMIAIQVNTSYLSTASEDYRCQKPEYTLWSLLLASGTADRARSGAAGPA